MRMAFLSVGVWLGSLVVAFADEQSAHVGLNVEVPALKALPEARRAEYVEALEKMLLAVTKLSKGAADEVQTQAQIAQKICDSDPRRLYSHGLALQKLSKPADALREFAAARQLAGDIYYPAWQAEVRLLVGLSKTGDAVTAMIQMAQSLSIKRQTELSDADQQAIANWLGHVVGYLEVQKLRPDVETKLADVNPSIPMKLRPVFEAGHVAATESLESLDTLIKLSLDADKDAQVRKGKELAVKAFDENNKVKADAAVLQTQTQNVATLAQMQLSDIDQKISVLERAKRTSGRVTSPVGSVQAAQSELFRANAQPLPKSATPSQRFQQQFRVQNAQGRVNFENSELGQMTAAATMGQATLVNQQLDQELKNLHQARQQVIQNNQLNAGQVQKQQKQIQQKAVQAGRLKRNAENLQAAKDIARSPHTRTLENQRHRLDAFVPWNFQDEAVRLLESFE